MYRDNNNGELYEDYESAYDAMLESITVLDYVYSGYWDMEELLSVILHNCPDAIMDKIQRCEEEIFEENFIEVDEEEEE